MASSRQMRKRISSVRSIRQITKAMKMVAAARLRKAQDMIISARPYARKIEEVLSDISIRTDISRIKILQPSKGKKVLLFVITADKGLCGSFNSNILRRAMKFMTEHHNKNIELIAVGRKGRDFFKRRELIVRHSEVDAFRELRFELAAALRDGMVDPYLNNEVGEVHLIYNEFKSAMAQRVICKQFLPVSFEKPTTEENHSKTDFIYEPFPEAVFSELLPQYFAIEIWNALLESYAAEMGARMTSMESATKNASEMISRLTLVSNRIRQAGITREIAEIVGGAEALK
ncbi:TPA: ATP synthase F1 subunit gamma [bacterium]|nr:MAG: ATP synthase F1 subunit gamma [Candidatus Hydrogenedentes bacterium CG1_02_42_14]PIU48139.1 MAG: ATP synthase F1 subunit gamma [Candidatus Hydrogenedentes bacterium CG07_land_8_20_14_0_80_42_17]HBW47866.1 ATP synthase F1 subunit gamma [bacterium]